MRLRHADACSDRPGLVAGALWATGAAAPDRMIPTGPPDKGAGPMRSRPVMRALTAYDH